MKVHAHDTTCIGLPSRRLFRAVALAAGFCFTLSQAVFAAGKTVNESARDIPVACDVDVVVVGGSSAGVAAAVAAAKEGAKVFVTDINEEAVAAAVEMGAEGIGLCRTEHMFLAHDRLPIMRRFIMSHDPEDEAAALPVLGDVGDTRLVDRPGAGAGEILNGDDGVD